jgi:hypothetical protein
MNKKKYYLLEHGKNSRMITLVFTGIVAFLIIFPFVAVNLRFQTGYLFAKIFDFVGSICLMGGGFLTMYSLLSFFVGNSSLRLRTLVIGIVFLWIGCWLTGTTLEILGIGINHEHTSPGYH